MKKYIINPLLLLMMVIVASSCTDEKSETDLGIIPQAAFTTDKENYSLGETVYLFDKTPDDTNVTTYYWHFGFEGAGSYSTDKNTSITYPKAGTYTIRLTTSNKEGGYKTSEKQITILPVNLLPLADFSFNPTVSIIGSEVVFKDLSTDQDGEIASWLWDFGDGKTSAEQNPKHTYANAGFIKIKLTVTDDRGESAVREKTIYVRASLTPGNFQVLWTQTFETSSTLRSVSPAVGDNGDIYVTSNKLKLHSYSPIGMLNWSFDLAKDGAVGNQEGSPSVDSDGTIYIGVGQGTGNTNAYLYAVNADGSEKWNLQIGVGARVAYTSPVISSDGNIAIGNRGTGGAVKLVDRNKNLVWSAIPSGGVGGAIAVAKNGTIYSGSTGTNGFASISPTGKISSDYLGSGYGANGTCPAIDESGNVYLVLNNGSTGTLVSYNQSGVKNWEYPASGSITQGGSAIGTDGTIYMGSQDGTFYAINKGGSLKWTYLNGSSITCVPAIDSEGNIHFTDESGNYTIVGANGTKKTQVKLGTKIWSSPVISEYGIIYVTVEDGGACKLIAIDYGIQGPAKSAWAQRGQNARKTFLQK
ncbi:PKD domain-containing protein [Dysgonomonas sp. ZJ709]|uniref:PKD domain-containing protein n=1 Tax=Dysgonomonas sp. ZJ709 TaxID=2709797 RepID=UPI0013EC4E4C|nr:PKD domain-containing protein [Dysgonomonas sp. ZJ709]